MEGNLAPGSLFEETNGHGVKTIWMPILYWQIYHSQCSCHTLPAFSSRRDPTRFEKNCVYVPNARPGRYHTHTVVFYGGSIIVIFRLKRANSIGKRKRQKKRKHLNQKRVVTSFHPKETAWVNFQICVQVSAVFNTPPKNPPLTPHSWFLWFGRLKGGVKDGTYLYPTGVCQHHQNTYLQKIHL